ncbi:MAG: hypothetical protein IPN72_14445 [Saprospiraceae bacterium]|nr:hypothetical protein [Saprospiraceae bacterium]
MSRKNSLFSLLFIVFLNAMAIGQDVKVSREIGIRNEFVYEIMPDLKGNTLVYRDRGNQFYFDIFHQI